MTEPTWKDPLLAEWWEGCSEETRALYAPVPSASATDLLLGFAETKQTVGLPDCAYHDAHRLRSLIDAELARGREAVEVLREVEYPHTSHNIGEPVCHFCGWSDPEYEPPLDIKLSRVGHAPDCRLAKVIKAQP